jgi:hypothetical protein
MLVDPRWKHFLFLFKNPHSFPREQSRFARRSQAEFVDANLEAKGRRHDLRRKPRKSRRDNDESAFRDEKDLALKDKKFR